MQRGIDRCRPRWDARIAILAIVLVSAVAGPRAQPQAPAQRLHEAIRLMESRGDYQAAVRMLRPLTKVPDRSIAARAWLLLGRAYETLGDPDAAMAYRQILDHFGDATDIATEARNRLAVLSAAAVSAGGVPALRQLAWHDFTPTGAPTPDGRLLPGTSDDLRSLLLMDLPTGRSRTLLRFDDGTGFPFYTALTRNGSELAYTWHDRGEDGRSTTDVRLIRLASPRPEAIFSSDDVASIRIARWTSAGDALLASVALRDGSEEIALLFRDGRRRTLIRVDAAPLALDLSPDDRFVVFDRPEAPGSPARDLILLDVRTSRTRVLAQHPGMDALPTWTADGSAVLFASNRSGVLTAWILPIAGGKPVGDPRRLVPALGRMMPLGVTRGGAFYFRAMSGLVDIYTADISLENAEISDPTMVKAGQVTGASFFSSWSPDGRQIAFTSRIAEVQFEPRSQSMVIYDVSTGRWREHVVSLSAMSYSAWSPDGKSVLFCGTAPPRPDGAARQGLWLIDVRSGNVTLVVSKDGRLLRSPRWRADGRAVLYSQRSAGWSILERDLRSGEERLVADEAAEHFELAPNGSRVAFVSRRGKGSELVVASVDGSDRGVVAAFQDVLMVPVAWSPDGEHVLVSTLPNFDSAAARATEVWSVRLSDGSTRRIGGLTLPAARTLRLSPDGKKLSLEAGIPSWAAWVMEGAIAPSPAK